MSQKYSISYGQLLSRIQLLLWLGLFFLEKVGLIMGIFSSLKKKLEGQSQQQGTMLKAPLDGQVIPIEEVPDPVFADKIVGDGVAIVPTGQVMVAPCDGLIGKIFETNHAFSMETPSGVELFVHFGIDTVELKGEGFRRIATEGQQVTAGGCG